MPFMNLKITMNSSNNHFASFAAKSYNVRLEGERPVLAAPPASASPQSSDFIKCPRTWKPETVCCFSPVFLSFITSLLKPTASARSVITKKEYFTSTLKTKAEHKNNRLQSTWTNIRTESRLGTRTWDVSGGNDKSSSFRMSASSGESSPLYSSRRKRLTCSQEILFQTKPVTPLEKKICICIVMNVLCFLNLH